ncbi:MAG: hypothetical protein RBR73_07105, partial [Halothiobacillaceae bacterium]|nr:hypothetical protein [Halothiobacillaceae bacterium]
MADANPALAARPMQKIYPASEYLTKLLQQSTRAPAMLTVYGLRNCDTMKKAFAWLDAAGLAWTLHD